MRRSVQSPFASRVWDKTIRLGMNVSVPSPVRNESPAQIATMAGIAFAALAPLPIGRDRLTSHVFDSFYS
jgi:hypothetical protein